MANKPTNPELCQAGKAAAKRKLKEFILLLMLMLMLLGIANKYKKPAKGYTRKS